MRSVVGVPELWDIRGVVGIVFSLSCSHLALTLWKAVQPHLRTTLLNPEKGPLTPLPAVVKAPDTQTQACLGLTPL